MKTKIYSIGNNLDSISKGWLKVLIDSQGGVDLAYSTKVELIQQNPDSEKVRIKEGNYENYIAHIPYFSKNQGSVFSYLIPSLEFKKNRVLRVKKDKIIFNGNSFEVIIDRSILKTGKYRIKLPTKTSKNLPPEYLDESRAGSRFAESWFPIYGEGDLVTEKYLHYGTVSEGCVTVKHKSMLSYNIWNNIYLFLMNSRNKDGLATLIIE